VGRPEIVAGTSIGNITVGGAVEFAQILAGYNFQGQGVNADAKIGAVKVGSWHASDLVAGVNAGKDGVFGSADDVAIAGGNANLISKIASFTVRAQAAGDRQCGVVAQNIGAVKVGSLAFKTSAEKDTFRLAPTGGTAGDLFAREVA